MERRPARPAGQIQPGAACRSGLDCARPPRSL